MLITLEIPNDIAEALSSSNGLERRALEALALDGYRSGDLSRGEVSEMLILSFEEAEEFLHSRHVDIGVSVSGSGHSVLPAALPTSKTFR